MLWAKCCISGLLTTFVRRPSLPEVRGVTETLMETLPKPCSCHGPYLSIASPLNLFAFFVTTLYGCFTDLGRQPMLVMGRMGGGGSGHPRLLQLRQLTDHLVIPLPPSCGLWYECVQREKLLSDEMNVFSGYSRGESGSQDEENVRCSFSQQKI